MNFLRTAKLSLSCFAIVAGGLSVGVGCAAPSAEEDDTQAPAADPDADGPNASLDIPSDEEPVGQTSQELRSCNEGCTHLSYLDVARGKYEGKHTCCKVGAGAHGYASGKCAVYTGTHYQTGSGSYRTYTMKYCNGLSCYRLSSYTRYCN